jgi:hypothetical protein
VVNIVGLRFSRDVSQDGGLLCCWNEPKTTILILNTLQPLLMTGQHMVLISYPLSEYFILYLVRTQNTHSVWPFLRPNDQFPTKRTLIPYSCHIICLFSCVLLSKVLRYLYRSPRPIVVKRVEPRKLQWADHVARIRLPRNAYRILVGKF